VVIYQHFTVISYLTGGFWLDGTDEFSEGMWEWASTGQAMDYTHWFPGEPNDAGNDEDCLLIHDSYPNGEWNDGLCSTHFKYICELK
jgi:glutamine synthetase type III